MQRVRAESERPRPIALAVVLAACLLAALAVGVTGCPHRPIAASLDTSARARPTGPGVPIGASRSGDAPSGLPEPAAPPTPAAATPPAATPPPPPKASMPAPSRAYKVVPVKDGGTIVGTCRLGRDVKPWDVERLKDNQKGCGLEKQPTERIQVGPDRALGNCVVFIRSIAAGKDFPEDLRGETPKRLVDQKTCRYVPHVSWVRTATQIVVGNSDLAEHNIHGFKDTMAVTQFNFSSKPQSRNEEEEAAFLDKPGVYILKCDIHPWMSGYVHVVSHPYHDVTSDRDDAETGRKAGGFTLADVPPGEWEVVCWHEGMKEEPVVQEGKIIGYIYGPDYVSPPQKVKVEAGKSVTVDFVVPLP